MREEDHTNETQRLRSMSHGMKETNSAIVQYKLVNGTLLDCKDHQAASLQGDTNTTSIKPSSTDILP
jgi:hypothetical protein